MYEIFIFIQTVVCHSSKSICPDMIFNNFSLEPDWILNCLVKRQIMTDYSEINFNKGISIGCPFSAVYMTFVCPPDEPVCI